MSAKPLGDKFSNTAPPEKIGHRAGLHRLAPNRFAVAVGAEPPRRSILEHRTMRTNRPEGWPPTRYQPQRFPCLSVA